MTPSRSKPGVAFWATVVVAVLPVIYVMSIGPAFVIQPNCPNVPIYEAYGPLLIAARRIGCESLLWRYVGLWTGRDESGPVRDSVEIRVSRLAM
jgi:hypothetical protein